MSPDNSTVLRGGAQAQYASRPCTLTDLDMHMLGCM
eukprot:COSAG01_NODE_29462_length_637_cov_0.552045_1_plen_35_part_01